jgi:alpha-tubulin suppressor-like RCC1 family protein
MSLTARRSRLILLTTVFTLVCGAAATACSTQTSPSATGKQNSSQGTSPAKPLASSSISTATYRWGAFWDGSGLNSEADSPVSVEGSGISAMDAANGSDMILTTGGQVETFGYNVDGTLGLGHGVTYEGKATPVAGLPRIVAIGEANDTDVAVDAAGKIYGWGEDAFGMLCQGNTKTYWRPVELKNLAHVVQAAGGANHMAYLQADGTLETCGGGTQGTLGDGSFANSTTPVTVSGLPDSSISEISAGVHNMAVLLANGQVWDWGKNNYGDLGNGNTRNSAVPVRVDLPGPAVEVYVGGDSKTDAQTLALLANGRVEGWGNNAWGQLGNGTTARVTDRPVRASALPGGLTWQAVVTGGSASYVLDTAGNVYAFGDNANGEVGNKVSGANVLTPVEVMSGVNNLSATAKDVVAGTGAISTPRPTS